MLTKRMLTLTLIPVIASIAAPPPDVKGVKGIYLDRQQHPTTLGLRFHIQLQSADGKRTNVPASYEFHSGDHFWLQIEARTGVYVYVVNRTIGASDKALEVVRDEDSNRVPPQNDLPHLVFGPEKIEPGKFRSVPKSSAMMFDKQTGVEKLYVILSPERIPDLEQDFSANGELAERNGKVSALRNLDKAMASWAHSARQAVPSASKGVVLDDPNGYTIQETPGQPMLAEVTHTHR